MRSSELRSWKHELEERLRDCQDHRECEELRRRIEEFEAEIQRRSSIGRAPRSPSEREDEGESPSDRANQAGAG